jgi:hypothetical protein
MSTLSSKQLDPVSCETQGHLWGDSACIMCKTPKPKYAPSLEFAMRQVERCRNYAPTDRVENEDTIVTLGDEIERLQEDLRLARIESAHFANTQRATQAELEMARVSSSELERYKRALYQANGQLMQLDKEPVKLDYSADEPSADAEKILEAYDACWIEDETGGHSRRTMDQLRDIGKRFNDARAAVLAAMRPAPPPREGYSQAYADQMRTALLRIAGWREIDRNSLGERLREIEEIALAALMPTVTKSDELPVRPYGETVAPAGPWRVVHYGSSDQKGDMIFDEHGCIAHFGEHHHEAVSRIVYEHNVSVAEVHDKA